MNLNDWEREREFILFITEYMDRFSVLMAKHHIFEPQFPSYVYLYYIPPPNLGDTMTSHIDKAHWHLSSPLSYDHFLFIVNIQFIGSIKTVFIC